MAAPPFLVEDDRPRSGLSRGAKLAIVFVLLGILIVVGLIVALVLWVRGNAEEANRHVPITAEVGECVAVNGGQGVIVSCDELHSYEVVDEFEWIDDSYPGVFDRIGVGGDRCENALETYVGSGYLQSRFDYEVVVGSEAQWQAGNRTAKCVIYDPFDSGFAGTARNSGE